MACPVALHMVPAANASAHTKLGMMGIRKIVKGVPTLVGSIRCVVLERLDCMLLHSSPHASFMASCATDHGRRRHGERGTGRRNQIEMRKLATTARVFPFEAAPPGDGHLLIETF
jgi:hypothetical protein